MMKLRSIAKFSSNKFYELVQQEKLQIIPQVPEDAVLSKYLSFKETNKSNNVSKWAKQKKEGFSYSKLLQGSPYGSVQNFTYKNHELTLISTNYFRIDEKKLHKVIYTSKPDAIILQRRPDYHIHNFQLVPKGNDGIFSDREYLNGLKFTPQSIKQESPSLRPIVNALNKNKDDVLQKNQEKEILQQKGFETCIKYSSAYQTSMFFSEMPVKSYRQWIANTHTLMQLQQIFKVVCQRLPRYKNISFNPYQLGTLIYPDIFLKINDTYMATLIQMLIGTKKYKNILGIFGIVQNQAVKSLLQRNQGMKPIIQYLIPPGPKGTIVRDIQNFQIIQKHILLDIMFYGKEVTNIKTQYFHTTNAVIQKYGKQIDKQVMMKFRYDKTMEYLELMDKKYKEGEEEIKKQFVRETLREKK